MPPKRTSKRPDILNRNLTFSAIRTALRVGVDDPRDREPEIEVKPWLELRGEMDEAVRATRVVTVSLYPDARTKVGTARPPAVGAIVGARDAIEAVVSLPHTEFDRLWTFALSGRLTHGWMAFTKPHYNSGLVLAVSFSTESDE